MTDEAELRKLARRNRISGKTDCQGTAANEEASLSKNEVKSLNSTNTVKEAVDRIDTFQAESTDKVTEARLRSDEREARRRGVEEDENKKRADLLKCVEDTQHDDAVALGWETCKSSTNLADLLKHVEKQKSISEAALAKLEGIGSKLGSELREKDHEYVTALKRNRHEVELLQKCIAEEHLMLKDAFEKELKLIEESLIADRDYILNTNKAELEALIKKRKQVETESLDMQRRIISEHRDGIEESESKAEQDREDLKKNLESEVRRLEIELEDTRAQHQFDTDRLEYNVRVLTELSENEEAVKKQKRRIMKGKEELTRELDGKHQAKAKGIRQNELLESDCERIEKQASGLTEKFERFKISDDKKYTEVLSMHREDIQKLDTELKQSQEFIFDGAIGCDTSAVTLPDDIKSSNTHEGNKTCSDEFGLESKSFDKSDKWNQAEELMSNYRKILERRDGLTADVESIEHQNEALVEELKGKLGEAENEELAFPPSNMISVDT